MGKLNFTLTLKKSQLLLLTKAQKYAAQMAMDALKTDIEIAQVVPKNVGTLSESADAKLKILNKGRISLTYNTPYARRLYYHPEYNFSQDKHKNARGEWLEDYLTGNKKDFLEHAYISFYKHITGV